MRKFSFFHLFLVVSFTLYTLNFTLPLSWAGSSSTLTADSEFIYGQRNNVQIEGQGLSAVLKLLNNWVSLNPYNLPQARKYTPLAYDSENKKIILFGGLSGNQDLSDTWIYNPETNFWEQKFPTTSPSPRYGHVFVYLGNGKTLLFGGKNSQEEYFNDTWVYDFLTNSWSKQAIYTVLPSSRAASSAVSIGNNTLILFGGYSPLIRSSETWKYIFDTNSSSWTKLTPPNLPSARDSAGMAYIPEQEKIVLFGGYSGSDYLSDTWVYNLLTNDWVNKNPSLSPSKRSTNLAYDSFNQVAVLFGGLGASVYEDTWFYDLTNNQWRQVFPLSSPEKRFGHGLIYTADFNKVYLFGGQQVSEYQDTWGYLFRPNGTYISPVFDVPFNTILTWDNFVISPGAQAENTELKFQIATSVNRYEWTEFKGYDGTSDTFYIYAGTPLPIWSGHQNQRYLKFKAYFNTTQPPNSPILDSFTVHYNRDPYSPSPYSPLNNSSINDLTPSYSWNNATDDDGDKLTYQLQVDRETSFASPDIDLSGISESLPRSSTEPFTSLFEGKWYWRVRAKDSALNSQWSDVYTFWVDTTPPAEVTDLVANIGPENGTVELTWTNSGDDGNTGILPMGSKFKIQNSKFTEVIWSTANAQVTISTSGVSPGQTVSTVIKDLTDGTTYYIRLWTADEAGNWSGFSNCPHAFTNAPPTVNLLSPNGSEIWQGSQQISWTYSDPNPGDTHNFAIYLSPDNGNNYSLLVTSGLPNGTTFYLWDTRQATNGNLNRIKVIATDKRGLSGEDYSDSNFTIENRNESPEISIVYPLGGEILSGEVNLKWTYSDPNGGDTHQFEIFLSSDNGANWTWRIDEVFNQSSYLLKTAKYPNGINYRLKIKVTDNGGLGSEDTTKASFAINNQNFAPQSFSLIFPSAGIYLNPLVIFFQWERAIDPNPEDIVTYTLWYSTESSFATRKEIKNLSDNYWFPPEPLEEEKTYYWKVKAVDPFGSETWGKEMNFFFSTSRGKVDSFDFLVHAEVLEGLPENGYLRIDKIYAQDYPPLSWANQRSLTDSLTRTIYNYAYRIGIYDKNNNLLYPRGVKIKTLFRYSDENNDGYFDGTRIAVENLRVCNLEEGETSNFWKLATSSQEVNRKEKKVIAVANCPKAVFSLLGYSPAPVYLSEVKNYPNPFTPGGGRKTRIEYYLPEESIVTIRIYNLVGDLVWVKENAQGKGASGGPNVEFWDGKNDSGMIVANGAYLCAIFARPAKSAGGEERKMLRLIAVIK